MCAEHDLLALGFSNGVLILFDTDKLDIKFSNKRFDKNERAIEKLQLFHYENTNREVQATLLLSLSNGMLAYFYFPKISFANELIVEDNIVDFETYKIGVRPFLATVHKSRHMKIYRLRKKFEYKYITMIMLD